MYKKWALALSVGIVFQVHAVDVEPEQIKKRISILINSINELDQKGTRPKHELNNYLTDLAELLDSNDNLVKGAEKKVAEIEAALSEKIEINPGTTDRGSDFFHSTLKAGFLYTKDSISKDKLIPLTNGTALTSKNSLKVVFEVKQTEYVYVLHQEEGGECSLLNSKNSGPFAAGMHEIPSNKLRFFSLADVKKEGTQKVVVRSSAQPLSKPADCAPIAAACENCVHLLSFPLAKK